MAVYTVFVCTTKQKKKLSAINVYFQFNVKYSLQDDYYIYHKCNFGDDHKPY